MDTKTIIALFCSVIATIIAYFVLDTAFPRASLPVSIVFGLFFYVILYPVLWISEKKRAQKLAQAEAHLPDDVICITDGNVIYDHCVKNCRLYLYSNELLFLCLDDNPVSLNRISVCNIAFCSGEGNSLNIHMKNSEVICVSSTEAQKLHSALELLL